MKKGLREKLLGLINVKGQLSYGEVCQYVAEEGYKISTAERRLRELKEDGLIETTTRLSRRHTTYISGYLKLGLDKPKPPEPQRVFKNGEWVMVFN